MTWKITIILSVFFASIAFVLMPLTWEKTLTVTAYRDLSMIDLELQAIEARISASEKILSTLVSIKNLKFIRCKNIMKKEGR